MPLDVIDREGEAWGRSAGGTAGNVAAILAFLGWDSALAGRVGDDRAGDELIHDLGRAGVDCSLIGRDPGALTNRLLHIVTGRGHRYRFTCPHCEQKLPRSRPLRLEELDRVRAARPHPDVYFFDRANPATVSLAEGFSAAGTLVVYEPSTPASAALLHRALAVAQIVKGSVEHAPGHLARQADGRPGQLSVVTEGAGGAKFRIGHGPWRSVGVFPTRELDASGAGDWTTAGMLHRLNGADPFSSQDVEDAILFGHSLAALNCATVGARGLMDGRSRAAVLGMATRLRKGYPGSPVVSDPVSLPAEKGRCRWCLLSVLDENQALRETIH